MYAIILKKQIEVFEVITGERIKKRRTELNITAEELGIKTGVDRSTVYRYENGDIGKFPASILEPFAKTLQTSVAYLMGWTDNPDSSPENRKNLCTNDGLSVKNVKFIGRDGAVKYKRLSPEMISMLEQLPESDE